MASRALKVHKPYPRTGCPHCGGVPRKQQFHDGENACPLCGKTFSAAIFLPPPEVLYVKPIGMTMPAPDGAEIPAAAPCAKHELNAAAGSCERCGNFICALCRSSLAGKEYCPACFERLLEEGAAGVPPAREPFYAGIASILSGAGLAPGLGLVAGPATVFYGIKGFRQASRLGMPGVVKFNVVSTTLVGIVETLVNWAGLGYILYMAIEKSKW